MTTAPGKRDGGPAPAQGGQRGGQQGGQRPESLGWSILSYLIGGMALYGGIGWLVGRWVHVPVLFPVGMLAGLGMAIALVIFRVTRS